MTRRLSRLSTTLAVAATLAVAGCGSGSGGSSEGDSPKDTLVASVGALGDADILTTTLQLETTPEDLQAVAESTGDELSTSNAEAIASAQLVIETTDDKSSSLRAVDGGKTLFEIRTVDKTIYLQGDLQGVLDIAGKPDALEGIQAQAAQLPDFVQAFINGDWVSLNSEALSSLAGSLGAAPSSSPSADEGPKLLADLRRAIEKDITVKDLGEEDEGQHLQLSGNVKDLAVDLQNAVQSSVPGGGALSDRLDASTAPSRVVTLDAWVNDDALSKLSLDLAQFDDDNELPAGTSLPLVLTFEQTGHTIEAPTSATPVDLSQLGTLVNGLGGPTGSA
jgi:hypothetical protein